MPSLIIIIGYDVSQSMLKLEEKEGFPPAKTAGRDILFCHEAFFT